MEAIWTMLTQAFWWTAMIISSLGLVVMLAVLFWAICRECDKEKFAETK